MERSTDVGAEEVPDAVQDSEKEVADVSVSGCLSVGISSNDSYLRRSFSKRDGDGTNLGLHSEAVSDE